jgi:hypothetical protein
MCFDLPARQGIFQVQSSGTDYIVNIMTKSCDYKKWDLTRIPCNHTLLVLSMREFLLKTCCPHAIQFKHVAKCMGSTSCLAKLNLCGRRLMGQLFCHLFMRRRFVGHPNLGGSNLMKSKGNMGQSYLAMAP